MGRGSRLKPKWAAKTCDCFVPVITFNKYDGRLDSSFNLMDIYVLPTLCTVQTFSEEMVKMQLALAVLVSTPLCALSSSVRSFTSVTSATTGRCPPLIIRLFSPHAHSRAAANHLLGGGGLQSRQRLPTSFFAAERRQ